MYDLLAHQAALLPFTACRRPGSFCAVRLLAGEQLSGAWPQLQRRLAQAVLDSPPYAMAWLEGFPQKLKVRMPRAVP